MSKNIKIGKKTYTGVKYIKCACADEEGVYGKFIDVDDIPVTSKAGAIVSGTVTSLTAEDLAGATKLKYDAFYKCEDLESITIPNSVTSIGEYAFAGCSKLASITIPNSVTSISGYAFKGCSRLKSAILPSGIKYIAIAMFLDCTNLESITIPNSVTGFGEYAFSNCSKLTSITIPNSVTSIDMFAFTYCYSLKSITIPASVKNIGAYALVIGSSSNKATITFERTTPPTISSNTFDKTTLAKIIVPAGCGDTYKAATNWAAFADYIEEASAE